MKKIIYPFIILLVIAMSDLAIAISSPGVLPALISVNNVLRGQEINVTLTLRNSNDFEEKFSLNVTGEIVDWISFYSPENASEQINDIIVPSNGSKNVFVIFKIPQEAPNKLYTSKISVQGIPTEMGGENTSSIVLKTPVSVSLYVVGEQLILGEVLNITTKDIEINKLLRIYVEFENTGGVTTTPIIEVSVKKNGAEVANFIHDSTSVMVGNISTIEAEWDSTGQTVGDYSADVKVFLNNKMIESKEVNFKILERGTLSAEGKVKEVVASSEVKVGQPAKIQVQFQNTGEIDLTAKITGEVYLDNNLVDNLNGDETLVKVGENGTLTAYFKPTQNGNYSIKGNIAFEGKKEPLSDITINAVGNPPSNVSIFDSQNLFLILFIVFAFALVIIGIIINRFKKSRK
jgi:hypothetical protein